MLFSTTQIVAIVGILCGAFGSAMTLGVNAWLGGRKATNEDARLGLDALKSALEAATEMADALTAKLRTTEQQIVKIERQAYRVLSENNRFRIVHGIDPAISLDSFEPIDDGKFKDLVARLDKRE